MELCFDRALRIPLARRLLIVGVTSSHPDFLFKRVHSQKFRSRSLELNSVQQHGSGFYVRTLPSWIGLLSVVALGSVSFACEGESQLPEGGSAFSTGGSSFSGGSGGTHGSVAPSGGSPSISDDDDVIGTDYGLSGEGGATAKGLGEGDLTVLLLIDRSSSMTENWDSGSKWEVSLNAFFLGLVGVEDQVTLGALFFPTDGDCSVAPMTAPQQFKYQSGRHFVSSWKAKSSSIFPEGSTPLGPAFEQANVALIAAREAGLMDNRRFRVVVVTDGTPNCGTDPNRVISLAQSWRSFGVEIRVIGLPGSEEAASFLKQLAEVNASVENPEPDDDLITPGSGSDAEDEFYDIIR